MIFQTKCKMFADDIKLWATISNATDSKILQEDLNRLQCWFNPENQKCKVMRVGVCQLDIHYKKKTRLLN